MTFDMVLGFGAGLAVCGWGYVIHRFTADGRRDWWEWRTRTIQRLIEIERKLDILP